MPQEGRDGAILVTTVFPVPPSMKDVILYAPLTHPHPGCPPTDQRPGKDSEAWVPDSEERLILREEFTSRMHQRFLDGKDGDFDYRCAPALTTPIPHPEPQGCGPWGHTA